MKEQHTNINTATMNHTNSKKSSDQIFAFSSSETNNSSPSSSVGFLSDNIEANTTNKNKNTETDLELLQDKDCGRERLKKYREEVAGQVLIPDKWGQEEFLKDWIDCSTFDMLVAPEGIASARQALVASTTSHHHHHQKLRTRSG